MDDQYGLPDLRQFMAGTVHYPVIPENTEPLSGYRDLMTPPQQQYETIMMGEVFSRGSLVEFGDRGRTSIATTNTCITTSSGGGGGGVCKLGLGLEMDEGGNNSRWPRQETLTLLGIRSRLDYKFKEGAIQKGPLWDDVSRIMAEENGYQRSGKKCREKFENLYKYYKKTRESKASRQDGKHYRFFHQLEALYGSEPSHYSSETNFVGTTTSLPYHTTNNDTATINRANRSEALRDEKHCESLSFTNPSEFETSSSENNDDADHDLSSIAFKMNHNDSMEKIKRMSENHQCFKRTRKSWEARSKDFVDSKMRRLIETQENWMEKMLKTMETRGQERMCREEEWKKQDAARFDREQKFWANKRAWLEARDAAFMEVLKKLNGKELAELSSPIEQICLGNHRNNLDEFVNDIPVGNSTSSNINRWPEFEISNLIHLRTGMDSRLESRSQKELREEISAKMAYLGYDRSGISCKEKWESLGLYGNRSLENDSYPEENLRNINYFQLLDSFQDKKTIEQEPECTTAGVPLINNVHYPSNLVMNNEVRDSCFRVLAEDGEHLWEKYGLKPRKGRNQQDNQRLAAINELPRLPPANGTSSVMEFPKPISFYFLTACLVARNQGRNGIAIQRWVE